MVFLKVQRHFARDIALYTCLRFFAEATRKLFVSGFSATHSLSKVNLSLCVKLPLLDPARQQSVGSLTNLVTKSKSKTSKSNLVS